MHKLKKLYCRTFQAALMLSLPFLPYRNPKIVGSVNALPEIQETDISKLAYYADKEANPLYPVPVLMDAEELEKFYRMVMPDTGKDVEQP